MVLGPPKPLDLLRKCENQKMNNLKHSETKDQYFRIAFG